LVSLTGSSPSLATAMLRFRLIIAVVALASPPAGAQSGANQTAAPAPCSRSEHRQFDFWLGEWDVRLPDGRAAGTNRIRAIHAGCALQEEWTGARGSTGTSLNAYDPRTGRWHQTWIGNDGSVLLLDGGMKGETMELVGPSAGPNGSTALNRIRWTPLPGSPAGVRQLWETSTDGGQTWSVTFDGTYRRRGG
jgi:hypothetical protein